MKSSGAEVVSKEERSGASAGTQVRSRTAARKFDIQI